MSDYAYLLAPQTLKGKKKNPVLTGGAAKTGFLECAVWKRTAIATEKRGTNFNIKQTKGIDK